MKLIQLAATKLMAWKRPNTSYRLQKSASFKIIPISTLGRNKIEKSNNFFAMALLSSCDKFELKFDI